VLGKGPLVGDAGRLKVHGRKKIRYGLLPDGDRYKINCVEITLDHYEDS
jgi:hypothetical protein